MPNRISAIMKPASEAREEPGRLPFRVSVMFLLQQELRKTSPDLSRIDELINQDPALAAIILAHTNRIVPNEIACVAQGLALLDSADLGAVFESAVASSYASKLARGFPAAAWCDYSVQVARVARSLAIDIGFPGAQAYTAGLLHATGELVMHLFPRGEVVELDTKVDVFGVHRSLFEVQALGYSYARFSSKLATSWGLPPLLVKAIEHHENPFAFENYHTLTSILHLAVWRVRVMREQGAEAKEANLHGTYPSEVALALGLDMDMVLQRDSLNWADAWQESV